MISGVQRPTAGEVALRGARLSGRDVEDVAALGVTRTFQTPVMFWGLTVRESIEVALSARARRVDVSAVAGARAARVRARVAGPPP